MKALVAVMVCAACGDPAVPADAALPRVTVNVREPGVAVVFEAGGTTTVVRSDAAGAAALATDARVDVHVVRAIDATHWSVATFARINPGAVIEATGGAATLPEAHSSVRLPDLAGARGYELRTSASCHASASGGSSTIAATFSSDCAGTPFLPVATADDGEYWLDQIGHLQPGGSTALLGAWQPASPHAIAFSHLPAGATAQAAMIAYVGGTAATDVGYAQQAESNGAATTTIATAGAWPISLVRLEVSVSQSVPALIAFASYPLPADAFDAAQFPALLGAEHTASPEGFAWPPAPAYDLVMVGAMLHRPDGVEIAWRGYAPADARALAYPALPDELAGAAAIAGTTSDSAGTSAQALGAPYATTVQWIDADAPIYADRTYRFGAIIVNQNL